MVGWKGAQDRERDVTWSCVESAGGSTEVVGGEGTKGATVRKEWWEENGWWWRDIANRI